MVALRVGNLPNECSNCSVPEGISPRLVLQSENKTPCEFSQFDEDKLFNEGMNQASCFKKFSKTTN